MSTVEVTQSEYETLRNVRAMVESLWNDPEKGMKVKELVKEKFPNVSIPELDAVRIAKKTEEDVQSKWEAANKALLERIEKTEKELLDRDEAARVREEELKFQKEAEDVRKKYSFTSEGMEKVFARMKEKNNPDVEAAALYVIAQEPKPSPAGNAMFSPSTIDMFGASTGADEWKELNEAVLSNKVDQWFDRTAQKVLEEFQQ